MALSDALNKRKTGQEHVVPVPTKADGPVQSAPQNAPVASESGLSRPLRNLSPGEVGTKVEPSYPAVPYDEQALRTLLARLGKGVEYLQANLDNEQGSAQLGYFIDVMESTTAMIHAHMANAILNKD